MHHSLGQENKMLDNDGENATVDLAKDKHEIHELKLLKKSRATFFHTFFTEIVGP